MFILKNDEDFFELKLNSESGSVKPIPVFLSFEIAKNNGFIQTLEGVQSINKDDFVMTGLKDERYCVTKEKFYKKYTIVKLNEENINLAKKNISLNTVYEYIKPSVELMTIMNNELFKISNHDYLIRYEKNDFGIIKNDLFFKLYEII